MNSQRYRKTAQSQKVTAELDWVTNQVFAAIDGSKALSAIAETVGISIPVLWQSIAKLKRRGLIEEGIGNSDTIGIQFANKTQRELTKAVGPMSNVIIQKVAKLMKFTWPHIPIGLTREFIYRLVNHIPALKQKEEFKITMFKDL